METIIASLIGAVVSLLLALIAIGPLLRALGKQLEVHEKDSAGRKGALSKEHDDLSKGLSHVQAAVTFLKEGRIADDARREVIKGQALEAQKALEVLNATLSRLADLETELAEVKEENMALKKENAALRQRCDSLYQVRGQDQSLAEEEEPEV